MSDLKQYCYRILLIILPGLVVFTSGYGKNINSAYKKGAKALQFEIARNLDLRCFNGGIISIKYHLSNRSALRFGASIGFNDKNDEIKQDLTYWYDNNRYANSEINRIERQFSISVQYLNYVLARGDLGLYSGLGSSFAFSRVRSEISNSRGYYQYPDLESGYSAEAKEKRWNIGVSVFCGIEWLVKRNIGIHGEYVLNVSYQSHIREILRTTVYSDQNELFHDDSDSAQDGISILDRMIKFGVSFYF